MVSSGSIGLSKLKVKMKRTKKSRAKGTIVTKADDAGRHGRE